MLHILWLVLKIIGIILAVIAGVLILLICVVLFVPVCYRLTGESHGTLDEMKIRGRISWLFGLLKITADVKGRNVDFQVKLMWKTLGGESGQKQQEEARFSQEDPGQEDEFLLKEELLQEEDVPEEKRSYQTEEASEKFHQKEADDQEKEVHQEKELFFERIRKKISDSYIKFRKTVTGICDKIKLMLEKKERLMDFITDDVHVSAFVKVKEEVFKIIKRVMPGKVEADIRFGFEDPYHTGQALAILSILYPFMGKNTSITPDFEKQILVGNVAIKGNIFILHLLVLAVNLLVNEKVRRTIKDIRNFKL